MVHSVGVDADPDLLHVIDARRTFGAFPRLGQRGQQHRGQNRDDGDHDQELDQ